MTQLTPRFLAVLALTIALLPMRSFAASHTWSGAVNGNFSTAGNWSSGGVPTLAETNILIFPAGATRTTITNNIGALKVSLINFTGGGYVVRGASTITVEPNLISIVTSGGSNTIESSLSLVGSTAITVNSGDAMVLSGSLSGTNPLVKFGNGPLYFRGPSSNPLSGSLTIFSGELHFQKTGLATPYNGNSISIGSTNVGDPTQLFLYADNQIPDGADLAINPSGALIMNGFSDIVDSVTMHSGYLDTGAGTLGLNTGLFLTPRFVPATPPDPNIYESPTIYGTLEFHGAASTLFVSNAVCNVNASIVENGLVTVLNKTGAGTLGLLGGGNFTGALNVNQGTVYAALATSLGTAAGNTTVASGASLILGAGMTTSESLNLAGSGVNGLGALQISSGLVSSFGNITLTGETSVGVPLAGHQLFLNGILSGAGGLRKVGEGELRLLGPNANTFNGASFVAGGKLILSKNANVRAIGSVTVTNGAQLQFNADEQMDNAGVLSIYSGGSVNLTNRNETVGGLNLGRGVDVNTGTGTFTLLGDVFVGAPYSTGSGQVNMRGFLSLGGGIRRFRSVDTSFRFDCVISDGAGVGGLRLEGDFSLHQPGTGFGYGFFHLIRSNTFTGPVFLDFTSLRFHSPGSFGASGGGVIGTNMPELLFWTNNLVITGETLTSMDRLDLYTIGTNKWSGPMVVDGTNSFIWLDSFGSSNTLTVDGPISGSGRMVIGGTTNNYDINTNFYASSSTFRFMQSNSYAGSTEVVAGTLAIRHPQGLGSGAQGTTISGESSLRLELPNGAVLNEALTLEPSYSDTPSIVLAGVVTNHWNGPISMIGPSRFSVLEFYGKLVLNTAITGVGSLAKTGRGTLTLAGSGTNQLSQLVAEHGTLRLAQTGGYAQTGSYLTVLGDDYLVVDGIPWTSPAIVQLDQPGQLSPTSSLFVGGPYGRFVLNDQNLTLAELTGAGGLYLENGTLTLSNGFFEPSYFDGLIEGNGGGRTNLIKQGPGSLYLHGPAYTFESGQFWFMVDSIHLFGGVQVQDGFLSLNNGIIGSLQIAPGTAVSTRSAPVPGVDPSYEQNGLRLGSLSGGGNLSLVNGAWVYVGNDHTSTVFDGAIDGVSPAKLIKSGTGALTLQGSGSAYTGGALVERGTLLVNTLFNCNVHVQPKEAGQSATLGGIGELQVVTVTGVGAAIAPGATTNTPSFGRLKVDNLNLGAGSAYRCQVGGTNAGVNMDQVDSANFVGLAGGFADFTAFGLGVTSNRYAVVKSFFPINSTFLGDPEGDYIFPAAGRFMVITYLTAGGKEVTLIEQQGSPIGNFAVTGLTALTNGQVSLVGTGAPSVAYFVLASTNLSTTNWVQIGQATGHPFSGNFSFVDTNAPNFPMRFYRFALP